MYRMLKALGAFLLVLPLSAQPCRNLEDNSCWHARNQSNQSVRLTCSYFERINREIFVTGPMTSNDIYSYQFDQGWADSLGFAVSNLNCEADYGQVTKKIHIPQMPFGAHITFVIEPTRLRATVYSSYGRQYQRDYQSNS